MTAKSPRPPDELEPARAIRRALAAKGLKARDVGLIAVWATGPLALERAELAVTMGLGRFAAGVETVYDDPNPVARCAAAVARTDVAVAVALVIGPDGNHALAFSRP
ncbi:MAG: hypothetical protein ABI725_05275 [Chloroflexota bacterium]